MLKKGLSLFFQVLSRMNFVPKYWLIGWERFVYKSYYFRALLVSHVCKAFTSHFTEIETLILTNWVKNGDKEKKQNQKSWKRRWNSQRLFLGQFSRASCLMSVYKTLKETYVFEFLSVTIYRASETQRPKLIEGTKKSRSIFLEFFINLF